MSRVLLGLLLVCAAGCVTEPPGTDPTPTPAAVPPAEIVPGPFFEEITEQTGVVQGGEFGFGVAVADLNEDGWPDLFIARQEQRFVYINNGDLTFSERGAAWGFEANPAPIVGTTFADYDNDGDQDLFQANPMENRLYRNEGDHFVEVGAQAGFAGSEDHASVGTAFSDFDGDGDLDAWVANGANGTDIGDPDRILLNNGDGTFSDISDSTEESRRIGAAFISSLTDVDHDGDPDAYLVNDFGWIVPNQLFINEGPDGNGGIIWRAATEECGCDLAENGMGLAIGDYDRDGFQDLFTSNGPGLPDQPVASMVENLLKNNGDGTFTNVTLASRAFAPRIRRSDSWGIQFLDVDHDMWPDVFVPFGYGGARQPDALLMNRGGWFEEELAPGIGSDDENRSAGIVDLDLDGCLDVVVVGIKDVVRVYRNLCELDRSWVGFHLEGTDSPRDPIGAVVRVTAGGMTQREELFAGSTSVHSSRWKVVHFGLGHAETMDRVEVRWPSGLVQEFEGLEARAYYDLVEGGEPEARP